MNKPNLTLAAFCANFVRSPIEDYVRITLYLPEVEPNETNSRETKCVAFANSRNLAMYGQWYVTSIDFLNEGKGFDLLIEENPRF